VHALEPDSARVSGEKSGVMGLREPLTRAFFGQILGRIDRLARFVGAGKSATVPSGGIR